MRSAREDIGPGFAIHHRQSEHGGRARSMRRDFAVSPILDMFPGHGAKGKAVYNGSEGVG